MSINPIIISLFDLLYDSIKRCYLKPLPIECETRTIHIGSQGFTLRLAVNEEERARQKAWTNPKGLEHATGKQGGMAWKKTAHGGRNERSY